MKQKYYYLCLIYNNQELYLDHDGFFNKKIYNAEFKHIPFDILNRISVIQKNCMDYYIEYKDDDSFYVGDELDFRFLPGEKVSKDNFLIKEILKEEADKIILMKEIIL